MSNSTTVTFDPAQPFFSIKQAIEAIHKQPDHQAAFQAVVAAGLKSGAVSFALDMLKMYRAPNPAQGTEFDPHQGFYSVDEAIKIIHKQPNHMTALKAVVLANIDMDEFGFAADLLNAYYPADATEDKRFKQQIKDLKMVTDCLNS